MRPLGRGSASGAMAMAVATGAGLEAAKQQGRGDLRDGPKGKHWENSREQREEVGVWNHRNPKNIQEQWEKHMKKFWGSASTQLGDMTE